MIERHIPFRIQPGQADAFERFFVDRYRPTMSTHAGYVRAELLRVADDPTQFEMILRWRDAEAATGWRTSETHVALQPALAELASGGEVAVYDVVA